MVGGARRFCAEAEHAKGRVIQRPGRRNTTVGWHLAWFRWPEAPSILTVIDRFPQAVMRHCDDIGGGLVFGRGACMSFALITADGRLFDLDVWDWSMMVGGCLIDGLVALLG